MSRELFMAVVAVFGICGAAVCMDSSSGGKSPGHIGEGSLTKANEIVTQYLGSLDLNNKDDVASAINETHYRRIWRKTPVKNRCRYDEYRNELISVLLSKLQNSKVEGRDDFILLLKRMRTLPNQSLGAIDKDDFSSLGIDDIVLSEAEVW